MWGMNFFFFIFIMYIFIIFIILDSILGLSAVVS